MNTNPPALGIAALLSGQVVAAGQGQLPLDTFTLTLAGAALPQTPSEPVESVDEPLPEDMPSAAALAFLASLLPPEPRAVTTIQPAIADAGTDLCADEVSMQAAQPGPAFTSAARVVTGAATPLPAAPVVADAAPDGVLSGPPPPLAADPSASRSPADVLRAVTAALAAPRSDESQGRVQAQDAAVLATYGQVREPAAAEPVHAALRSPVGTPRWADELGSRVVLMSVRGQQEGSLRLSPEHLGPVEVRISVNQDTTNVWFGAQHADTRTALAEALPRLRELFAASGMALGHAGVSQEMPRREAQDAAATARTAQPDSLPAPEVPAVQIRRVSAALLDTWA